MSRIGKNPIAIGKVKVTLTGRELTVEGSKGKLSYSVHPVIEVSIEEDNILFKRGSDEPKVRALHGTQRAVVANMVKGVSEGYKKELDIVGVGYRGEQKGKGLTLFLGYSHPINFEPPAGVSVKMETQTKIVVEGIDKQLVGQVAAELRGFKEPEPYKGKGIKYSNEIIRRKAGKKSG
ncbi:MAG: Ribosomal protein [Fibrobacterota bacterium]|jgi:large subunit ribosomal protein L6